MRSFPIRSILLGLSFSNHYEIPIRRSVLAFSHHGTSNYDFEKSEEIPKTIFCLNKPDASLSFGGDYFTAKGRQPVRQNNHQRNETKPSCLHRWSEPIDARAAKHKCLAIRAWKESYPGRRSSGSDRSVAGRTRYVKMVGLM
jgi:hypothetical protein